MIGRLRVLAIAGVATSVSLTFAAACSTRSGSPTAPSTPPPPASAQPPVLNTVTVTSTGATASTMQLVAMARFSDGSMNDVTTTAHWASSNTAVAVVASGFVTILSAGDAEVSASYRAVTGTYPLHITTPPPRLSLQGTVYEVPPAQHALAGARVTIMSGADTGSAVVSDSTGAYRFSGLTPGVLILKVARDGYEDFEEGFTFAADRHEDLWLAPVPPTDASGAMATARCKDGTWSWSRDPQAACSANGGIAYAVCPGPLCVGVYAAGGSPAHGSSGRSAR